MRILLIEDNPGDVRLMREALRDAGDRVELDVTSDGDEAMSYLQRTGRFARAERPHLVFLDLNLTGKDGREVLAEMKADEDLRRIPVIVLTTSGAESDILRSYDLHANCFVTKPIDLEEFLDTVRRCESFWLDVATIPAG